MRDEEGTRRRSASLASSSVSGYYARDEDLNIVFGVAGAKDD